MEPTSNLPAPAETRLPAVFAPAVPPALPEVPRQPPIGRFVLAGGLVMALFFGGFGAWAGFVPLASAALATGTVRAESNKKTVQHLEGGIISQLLVHEGDKVTAGQVLIRLDTTGASSRYDALRHQRDLLEASKTRLLAEQAHADKVVFPPDLEARRNEPRIDTLLSNQEQIFSTRRQSYEGQRDILLKQVEQLQSQIKGLEAQIASADRQMALMQKEQKTVEGLVKKGLEREPRLLDLQRRTAALQGSRAESRSEIARAEQAIGEAQLKILSLDDEQSEKGAAELEKVQADLAKTEEDLAAATDVLKRRDIVAPMAGTVVNMKYFTPGGVITPGNPILDIVPSEDRLLIEAQVSPMDIDIVRPGLPAEVRFTAYKSRRTPVLDGSVLQISADRFIDERQGFPYYKALVSVDARELAEMDDPVELYPGMPTEIMIKTGERTFFEYLIQPVRDSFHKAFHEQ
jgi:HlyD family type I secretion membrane fusion protein